MFKLERLKAIKGARILLVEDNKLNRRVASELLTRAGMTTDFASNGVEAVEAVKARRYDLVLMDIQMPEMDGYEATRTIRRDERFKDLPILAMTADALPGDRGKCLEAGMNFHLTKPIEPNDLFGALLDWIAPGQREASPEIADAGDRPDVAIPRIQGLDVAAGLRNVRGNRGLYLKLLEDFHHDYKNIAERISTLVEAGDAEALQRVAHTIKGVAGSLGEHRLFRAAKACETRLRTDGMDRDPVGCGEFREACERFITALGVIAEPGGEARAAPDGNMGPEEASMLLDTLKERLEMDDATAEDLLPRIEKAFEGGEFEERAARLGGLVEDIEYEEALATLDDLRRSLAAAGGRSDR